MSDWLREGNHKRAGIYVLDKQPLESAGGFTGGGWKVVWHTTEGGNLESVVRTVRTNRSAPHFVIDPKGGQVIQCVPFDLAARTLEHNYGPETNRANAIQVEIVGFASDTKNWKDNEWDNLAGLAYLIERHRPVKHKVRNFHKPVKFSGNEFVAFSGYCGHVHVPGNNHTDPGLGFRGRAIVNRVEKLQKEHGK